MSKAWGKYQWVSARALTHIRTHSHTNRGRAAASLLLHFTTLPRWGWSWWRALRGLGRGAEKSWEKRASAFGRCEQSRTIDHVSGAGRRRSATTLCYTPRWGAMTDKSKHRDRPERADGRMSVGFVELARPTVQEHSGYFRKPSAPVLRTSTNPSRAKMC